MANPFDRLLYLWAWGWSFFYIATLDAAGLWWLLGAVLLCEWLDARKRARRKRRP